MWMVVWFVGRWRGRSRDGSFNLCLVFLREDGGLICGIFPTQGVAWTDLRRFLEGF